MRIWCESRGISINVLMHPLVENMAFGVPTSVETASKVAQAPSVPLPTPAGFTPVQGHEALVGVKVTKVGNYCWKISGGG